MLSENDEQLQSNSGSDGVKYLTMIGPMASDSGQQAQSSNSGSATAGAKYLTIVRAKDSGHVQSPQISASDSGQLPQSSNVGMMKLSVTQSQPGLGDEEYMEVNKESQLHASCEAMLNIDRRIPNQPASTMHDDDTLLQQSKQPNNDGYMKVDKHTSCFPTNEPVYVEVETTKM